MKRIYGREYEEKICKRMNSNYVTKYEDKKKGTCANSVLQQISKNDKNMKRT